MKTIDTLWGQWEEQPEPILKKLKEPQLCSIGEHHEILAYWSYKGSPLCDECLQDMADMNSDNAQELLPALKEILELAGKKLCPFCYEVAHIDDDIEEGDDSQELVLEQGKETTAMSNHAALLTPRGSNDEYCWMHSEPYGGGWNCSACNIARWCDQFSQFLLVITDYVYDRTGLIVSELDCIEIEYEPLQTWKVECEGWWLWFEACIDLNGDIHFEELYSLDVSDYE